MKGKRLVKVLFTLALLLNLTFAFGIKADAEGAEKIETTVEKVNLKANAKANSIDGITAKTMLYSTTTVPKYTMYTYAPLQYAAIPVTTTHTGWMYVDYLAEGLQHADYYENVTVGLVDEANLQLFLENPYGDFEYVEYTEDSFREDEEVIDRESVFMEKGDVYYFLIVNWSENVSADIGVRAKLFTTAQRTLEQGTSKWTTVSSVDRNNSTKATWFKVKPNTTGVMSVSIKEYGYDGSSGYVTLYNKDKKVLSDKVWYSSTSDYYKAYFGVKKGTTYYIKVENSIGSYKYNNKIGVKYGVTARTDRALGNKSNAKLLKRKADATNTLFVASRSKSTDWYKFKVTEKRTTLIRFDASAIKSGNIKITAYRGSKKIDSVSISPGYKGDLSLTYGTTYGKVNAGTYYLKVEKDAKTSGKYAIRYLK